MCWCFFCVGGRREEGGITDEGYEFWGLGFEVFNRGRGSCIPFTRWGFGTFYIFPYYWA